VSEERPRHRSENPAGERNRRSRRPWLLVAILALLLVALVVGALLLWRSLGEDLSGTATASDSINATADPRVVLTNAAGQINVEGVDDLRAVEFEVTKHALGKDPATAKQRASDVPVDVSREGDEVNLRTGGGRGTGADYTLRVPTGASVQIESEAGAVEVTGVDGGVEILAEAGDVSVSEVQGSVTVEAPQGDVDVVAVSTDTGQVELDVGSGDISLEDLVVGTLEASVESGDVVLSGRFSGGGRVFVGTGDITTRLPAEDTRELTLEANVGRVEREDATRGDEPSSEGS